MRAGWLGALAGGPLARAEERQAEELAIEALGRVGLAGRAGASGASLSFGEAKLVEIARALVMSPRLLMLDEPMAGVPHADQQRFIALIRELHAAGVSVLLVEHNMRVVMQLCDEILVLSQGRRLAEGTPEAIRRDPGVIAAYLGEDTGG